jgi:predicted kinase
VSDGSGWDVIDGCPRAGALEDGTLAEVPASAWPCAVLLVGAAGSGKSTLARQLAGDGDQALSIDALCQLASGDPYDPEATAAAVSALHLLAEARLRRGLTVIVDAVNILAADRRPLVAMARRHGIPAVAVVMATPLGECLARNARRPVPAPGRRWGGRVPEATVRAQYRQARQALPLLAAEGFAHVIWARAGQNGEGSG